VGRVDAARYFEPGTHRGHISLDLAKQSGHLNFKYGVSPEGFVSRCSLHSDDPRERISRELVGGEASPLVPSFFSGRKIARDLCRVDLAKRLRCRDSLVFVIDI